MSTISLVM